VTRVGSGAPRVDGQAIDWDAKLAEWEAKWDKLDGTSLAGVAPAVSDCVGPAGDRPPVSRASRSREAPHRRATHKPTRCSSRLRGVQAAHSTWTRADLMREIADSLPPEARTMDPAAAVALVHDMTDRAIAGEAEQVVCLDARSGRRRPTTSAGTWTAAASTPGSGRLAMPPRCRCPAKSSWYPLPGGRRPRT
jgi:hypothetical protein